MRRARLSLTAALLLLTARAAAVPWIAPGDASLRSDLTTLSDVGVLGSPLTTWPIPWADIVADLRDADVAALGMVELAALERIRYRARVETLVGEPLIQGRIAASENPRTIRTFDDTPRERGEIGGAISWIGERLAFEVNSTYVSLDLPGPNADDTDVRLDGSFVAVALGNWMLVAGYPERWWGPGWDGSLILSTNARPTPQIAISRNSAVPFTSRWLRWIGPWSLTAFMGQLDDMRVISDPLLFGMRFTFKPMRSLEIGFSRTAQWCGDGRPCNAKAFGNLLIGRDNRGVNVSDDAEPGNQLAGMDIRWVPPWFDRSTAVYAQWIGEDTRQGGPQIGSWMRQIGAEYSGPVFGSRWRHRSYVEYADTICREGGLGFSKKKFNCAYEHSTYRTGYRYEGRSIGHGMDGQGTSLSIGSIWMDSQDQTWQFSLRHIDTNQGSTPRAGHTVAPTGVTVDELLAQHSRPLWIGTLQIGLGYRDLTATLNPALNDASAFGWLEFVVQ